MKNIFLGVALFGSALFASNVGNCNCSNFSASVDLLYWKPMHEPIFWARRSERPAVGTPPFERQEFYLTGSWDPGVRVHFGYETPCFFTDLSYLYFSSLEKDDIGLDGFDKIVIQGSPPFTGATNTQLEAKSEARFRYQNIDGRIGYHFYSSCDRDLFVYGNGRWLRIDFRNLTQGRFVDTPTFFGDYFDQHMRFNGGGFGLGIGGQSSLIWGLGFNGSIGIMGIVGETYIQNLSDQSFAGSQPGPFFLTSDESWWHIIPAVDFHFGLDYEFCICKHVLIFEAAYELHYYINVLRFTSENMTPESNSERIPPITTQDVGFGGPLLKLTMLF